MFPMTITISTPAQLNAVMAALNVGAVDVPKTSMCAAPATESRVETAPAPATHPDPESVASPNQKPETLVQMTAGDAEKALHGHANRPASSPTYRDAADAITKLARTKGRDAAVAVLGQFGASKLPSVKPEQFADVIDACEKAGA